MTFHITVKGKNPILVTIYDDHFGPSSELLAQLRRSNYLVVVL